jgi:hypothetical protein
MSVLSMLATNADVQLTVRLSTSSAACSFGEAAATSGPQEILDLVCELAHQFYRRHVASQRRRLAGP